MRLPAQPPKAWLSQGLRCCCLAMNWAGRGKRGRPRQVPQTPRPYNLASQTSASGIPLRPPGG